jgi:hypothetical protein
MTPYRLRFSEALHGHHHILIAMLGRVPRSPQNVVRLSDEFGQYAILLTCARCRHSRIVYPNALARIFAWETELAAIARRMRCSKCDARQCEITVSFPVKPRGGDPRR